MTKHQLTIVLNIFVLGPSAITASVDARETQQVAAVSGTTADVGMNGIHRAGPESTSSAKELRAVLRNEPQVIDASIVGTLREGLQARDDKTRALAGDVLSGIVMRGNNIHNEAPSHVNESNRHMLEDLLPALLATSHDEDVRLRAISIQAMWFIAAPTDARVVSSVVAQYYAEPDTTVRSLIVQELWTHALEKNQARDLIVEALSDSAPHVRTVAALGVAKFRPVGALPILVRELQSGEPDTRREFVYAVGQFGKAAIAVVPLLKTLLKIENRPAEKRLLERTIQNLEASGR